MSILIAYCSARKFLLGYCFCAWKYSVAHGEVCCLQSQVALRIVWSEKVVAIAPLTQIGARAPHYIEPLVAAKMYVATSVCLFRLMFREDSFPVNFTDTITIGLVSAQQSLG